MIRLAAIINAPVKYLPVVGDDILDGTFIEIEGRFAITYRLVTKERGQIIDFDIAPTLDELMYYVFNKVTCQMAGYWEVNNRREEEDSRRQLFAKQLELLGVLSGSYRNKREKEIEQFLRIAPYKDK